MKAVLLVGGEGTRLRPLTCNTVKAMVPILNKPFLEHMIRYLRSYGVDDIILALCYLPERIERYFGDGSRFGVRLTYVMEESPLGTAGAVKNADAYLDDTFLVFNGDIFTDIDLNEMLAFHHERRAKATLAMTPVEDPTAYGVIETEDDGRVRRFLEKPSWEEVTTNQINAGIYILEREILEDIPPGSHFMFEHHLFPDLLARGVPIYGYPSQGYWIDIGTPEKYLQVHLDLLHGKGTTALLERLDTGETLRHGGGASSIHPTASIEGPVVLASGCSIGAGVRIKGPVAIGEGCQILEGATVEGAVLWRNVYVGRKASVRSCIIGDSSHIGDGSSVDHSSIIGDHVTIARNSRLSPDSKIWPGTEI